MNFVQQTPLLILVSIILYTIILSTSFSPFKSGRITKSRRNTLIVLIFIFCVFSFWGADWFGYLLYYNNIKSGGELSSIEPLYIWLIKYASPSYVFFRSIVWGASLFFFYKTIQNLKLDIPRALFFFVSIYLIWFSYARVTLAMSIMFYGLSLIHSQKKFSILLKLLGWTMILVSFYFHKSSIFGILIIVFSELSLRFKFNKTFVIVLVCLAFPLILFCLSNFLNNQLFMIDLEESSVLNDYMMSGSSYLISENEGNGLGVLLHHMFERTPYYLIAFSCCKIIFKRVMVDKKIFPFIWCFIFLTIFATLFAFENTLNTSVLYGRFIRFLQIPACLVLSYLYSHKIFKHLIGFTYKFAIVGVFYTLIYVLYNCIVAF